jgi:hypothetical protein
MGNLASGGIVDELFSEDERYDLLLEDKTAPRGTGGCCFRRTVQKGLLLLENWEAVLALRNDIAIREGVNGTFLYSLGKEVNSLVTTTLEHGGLGVQEIRVPL